MERDLGRITEFFRRRCLDLKRIYVKSMLVILMTGICLVGYHRNGLAVNMKIDANERLLVFAPHPDDEVLGCGGLMQRIKALGGRVGVVYLTTGDGCVTFNPFALINGKKIHRNLGYRRAKEALHAMEYLNISKDDMAFLGYPDRGLLTIWGMRENPYQEYRSRITGADYVFYRCSESQGMSYDFESLSRSLALIIERFKPTMVLIPSSLDRHPDHRATNFFVKTALKSRKSSPRIFSYLIHYKSWPNQFYNKNHMPKGLPVNGCELWLVPTEYHCKIQAMTFYRSQHPSSNHDFTSFAYGEEMFWREDLAIDDHHGVTISNRGDNDGKNII